MSTLGTVVGIVLGPTRACEDLPVHVVRPGETVWNISNLYGISMEDVATVNKSTDILHLSAGDSIRLPDCCQPPAGAILDVIRSMCTCIRHICLQCEHACAINVPLFDPFI